MAIKIPNNLPAKGILEKEQIIIIDNNVEDNSIRIEIAILNLMPTKIITETQLLRLLGNTPFEVNVTLIHPKTYIPKNTSIDHLKTFYKSFDDVKDKNFHGMIITGAPIEHMEFEDVEYWDELISIFEWTKSNVNSTLHICWGAQASLYYHYGVPKYPLSEKIFGVFLHQPKVKDEKLLKGVDDEFYAPHSRHTEIRKTDIEKNNNIRIIAESPESGVYMVASKDGRQIFITGHCEYDPLTLKLEYERDINKGLNIQLPKNYFPSDKVENEPIVKWRSHANLVFYNWIYYYAYGSK